MLEVVLYSSVLLLTGLGVGEALGIWDYFSRSFTGRLAVAIGLGLAVSSIAFFIGTLRPSASVTTQITNGLGIAGIVLLFVSFNKRSKFLFWARPTRVDLGILAVMVIVAVMLTAYFSVFPIFPQSLSVDFQEHLNYAIALSRGLTSSFPGGVLYFGVHYQIAMMIYSSGLDPLIASRLTIATLTVLSVPLFYLGSEILFASNKIGLTTAVVYAIPASLWFGYNFNAGLYPQFFGVLASLFLIATAVVFMRTKSRLTLVVLVVAVGMAYVSHYSILTVIPSLVVYALRKRQDRTRWIPAGLMTAPMLGALARPDIASGLWQILNESGGGNVIGGTPLSVSLSPIPVLSFLVAEVTNDIGAVTMMLLGVVAIVAWRRLPSSIVIPTVWLLTLLVTAPFNPTAWRFSLEALIPLTILAGAGLPILSLARLHRVVMPIVFIGLLTYNSWGYQVLLVPQSSGSASFQQSDFSAMQWLFHNTTGRSLYYSVTDWRFTYMRVDMGRDVMYRFTSNETEAVIIARQYQKNTIAYPRPVLPQYISLLPTYVIVTRLVTENLPPDPRYYPWDTFSSNANLTLIYETQDVRIYHLTPLARCYMNLEHIPPMPACPTG